MGFADQCRTSNAMSYVEETVTTTITTATSTVTEKAPGLKLRRRDKSSPNWTPNNHQEFIKEVSSACSCIDIPKATTVVTSTDDTKPVVGEALY